MMTGGGAAGLCWGRYRVVWGCRESWEETTGLYDSWDTIIGKVECVSGGCR